MRICDIAEAISETKSGPIYRAFAETEITIEEVKDALTQSEDFSINKLKFVKVCDNVYDLIIPHTFRGHRLGYKTRFSLSERLFIGCLESEDFAIKILAPIPQNSVLYELLLNHWFDSLYQRNSLLVEFKGNRYNNTYEEFIVIQSILSQESGLSNLGNIGEIIFAVKLNNRPPEDYTGIIADIAEQLDKFPKFLTDTANIQPLKKAN